MNAIDRLTRATALTLCAALVNAALPLEALAHVVTRVPVGNAPIGGPVMSAGSMARTGIAAIKVAGPTASLQVAPHTAPTPALTLTPSADLTASAVEGVTAPAARADVAAADAPAELAAPAAAAHRPPPRPCRVVAELAAAADAPAAGEFKADARASAVADTSRIASAFAALKRSFSLRSAEKLGAPSDAPASAASRAPPAAANVAAARLAPAGDRVAANDGDNVPPAPPAAPTSPASPEKGGPSLSKGLGAAAWAFIAALLIAQVGVEAMGTAMPQLVQAAFGDFSKVVQIAIFGSIAGIIGRQFAPLIIQRYGLRKTYLATEVLRMLSITAMLGLLATGHMTLPLMMLFYSLNGLFGGVAITSEQSIPAALLGQDEFKLRRFWNREQMILEVAGILVPMIAGTAALTYGAVPVLAAFPIAFAAAFAVLYFMLRFPAKVELMRKADLEKARTVVHDAATEGLQANALRGALKSFLAMGTIGVGVLAFTGGSVVAMGVIGAALIGGAAWLWRLTARARSGALTLNRAESVLGQFFKRIIRGFQIVWHEPILRYSFLGFSMMMMMNPVLYSIIAPGVGRLLGGTAGMAAFAGTIVALYSLGGLLGSLFTDRAQSRLEKAQKEGKMTEEQVVEALRKSMIRMMLLTIPTLAAFALVFLPAPAFLAGLAVPHFIAPGSLTFLALGMLPFGFAQVAATTMLRAYFQSKVPGEQNVPDANGFFGSGSLLISTLGLQALSVLFQHTSGMTPFIVIAGAMVPLGLYFLYLTRRLSKAGTAAPKAE